jgi:electron transfer flavoprotein alpha subunit
MTEILVLAEHRKGELRDITFEMICLANNISSHNNNIEVTTLLVGDKTADLSNQLRYACGTILVTEDPALANYNAEEYLNVLEGVIKGRKPVLTLVGNTATGMDLAPAIATRLSIPLVTDCIKINLVKANLEVERQNYGGKINVRLRIKPRDQYIASIRTGTFAADKDQGKSAQIENLPAPVLTDRKGRRRFIEYVEEIIEDVDITAADILVSVGRGIGKPEQIPIAESFAKTIGAAISCSRPVADKGWLPKSRQVGTSGKTVRPKIYIALGISGAFQHQAGMKNSDTIIAVNKDPKAPIFNVAHYGIVADLFKVLPVLTEKFT